MENIAACQRLVEALRQQAVNQADALETLNKVFIQEAEHLCRHDQARRLDDLGARVAQEVEKMRFRETAASAAFTDEKIFRGLTKFAFGAIAAAALGSREHPISAGARLAKGVFKRKEPYGTVLVAVGPGGVPYDVKVIPLSQEARERDKSESEIKAAMEAEGYHLMTPESFRYALGNLKEKILKGILALPVAASSLQRHDEGLSGTL